MEKFQTLHKGRYLSLLEVNTWEYVSRSNASGVAILVARTDQHELVLVEQFRTPLASTVIELPAGLVGDLDDPNEDILVAAQRELLEETGFQADHLSPIMSCPSTAGMSDEIVTFVLATGLTKVGPGGGDNSEDIKVHVVPLEQVDQWLTQRQIAGTPVDPKIFSALYWLKCQSGQLFLTAS